MANNTYGIIRPSLISADDVDILYNYRPTRNSVDTQNLRWNKIESPSDLISNAEMNTTNSDVRLPGIYNLSLPVSIFGNIGFYGILIRPKEIECTIQDVGALAAYPDIKGIVIDTDSLDSSIKYLFNDDNLVGYRVEYYSYTDGSLQRQEYYRIVTSNNLCEPVSQNLTSSNTNSNGYRFNASGSLCFVTLTPSTAPSFKPNGIPYIGVPSQKIIVCNTKFDPLFIEVEMTEHDIETISTMQEGEVVRNLDNGRFTVYNKNGEIYKQWEHATVKDNYTHSNIAEIKVDVSDNIDTSLDIEELKNA